MTKPRLRIGLIGTGFMGKANVFGVIGTGVMGAEHVRLLREATAAARVVAVCDADADRARAVAGDGKAGALRKAAGRNAGTGAARGSDQGAHDRALCLSRPDPARGAGRHGRDVAAHRDPDQPRRQHGHGWPENWVPRFRDAYRLQMNAWVRSIADMRVLLAIDEAARSGGTVHLDPQPFKPGFQSDTLRAFAVTKKRLLL